MWFDDRGSDRVSGTREARELESKFRISDFTQEVRVQQLMILSGEVGRYD